MRTEFIQQNSRLEVTWRCPVLRYAWSYYTTRLYFSFISWLLGPSYLIGRKAFQIEVRSLKFVSPSAESVGLFCYLDFFMQLYVRNLLPAFDLMHWIERHILYHFISCKQKASLSLSTQFSCGWILQTIHILEYE